MDGMRRNICAKVRQERRWVDIGLVLREMGAAKGGGNLPGLR